MCGMPLGPDAGGDVDRAVRLDGDPGSLVRPDPGAFDVVHDAQPDPSSVEPGSLSLFLEIVVRDPAGRLFQRGRVVSAVKEFIGVACFLMGY